jgi:hypothetical protein
MVCYFLLNINGDYFLVFNEIVLHNYTLKVILFLMHLKPVKVRSPTKIQNKSSSSAY